MHLGKYIKKEDDMYDRFVYSSEGQCVQLGSVFSFIQCDMEQKA